MSWPQPAPARVQGQGQELQGAGRSTGKKAARNTRWRHVLPSRGSFLPAMGPPGRIASSGPSVLTMSLDPIQPRACLSPHTPTPSSCRTRETASSCPFCKKEGWVLNTAQPPTSDPGTRGCPRPLIRGVSSRHQEHKADAAAGLRTLLWLT